MAEGNDVDISERLAEACTVAFERCAKPNRIEMVSGRLKRF
jgi:hypothetical protein